MSEFGCAGSYYIFLFGIALIVSIDRDKKIMMDSVQC